MTTAIPLVFHRARATSACSDWSCSASSSWPSSRSSCCRSSGSAHPGLTVPELAPFRLGASGVGRVTATRVLSDSGRPCEKGRGRRSGRCARRWIAAAASLSAVSCPTRVSRRSNAKSLSMRAWFTGQSSRTGGQLEAACLWNSAAVSTCQPLRDVDRDGRSRITTTATTLTIGRWLGSLRLLKIQIGSVFCVPR